MKHAACAALVVPAACLAAYLMVTIVFSAIIQPAFAAYANILGN